MEWIDKGGGVIKVDNQAWDELCQSQSKFGGWELVAALTMKSVGVQNYKNGGRKTNFFIKGFTTGTPAYPAGVSHTPVFVWTPDRWGQWLAGLAVFPWEGGGWADGSQSIAQN